MKTTLLKLALLAAILTFPSIAAAAAKYSVTNLGTLGGSATLAYGINDAGQVTGYSGTAGNAETHVYVYDGVMHDIGTLGGTGGAGYGINDAGQITGESRIAPNAPYHAFIYDGAMHDLGTLGGSFSRGFGINAALQVTGDAQRDDGHYHAFFYDGAMHDIGTIGGSESVGASINDSGQITGSSFIAGANVLHAFLYDGVMHDLGTLGGSGSGSDSRGFGINDLGQITGVSDGHAFLYDGAMHDLGTLNGLGSEGDAINNSGDIVGRADVFIPFAPGVDHAFLYHDNSMVDLNSLIPPQSGWVLSKATAINDAGQIAGWGKFNGQTRAFLLTPVPEPSSAALIVIATLVAVGRCIRKSR